MHLLMKRGEKRSLFSRTYRRMLLDQIIHLDMTICMTICLSHASLFWVNDNV
jgi:hypothetical protein